jgi:hypothetical protein
MITLYRDHLCAPSPRIDDWTYGAAQQVRIALANGGPRTVSTGNGAWPDQQLSFPVLRRGTAASSQQGSLPVIPFDRFDTHARSHAPYVE